MGLIRKFVNGLKDAFLRRRRETEMDDEMRFHLEMEIERNLQRGMAPAEAKRAARIAFGGIENAKEECRDESAFRAVFDVFRDMRFSMRSLWASKGFSFVIIATLALCVGANMAIFTVLYDIVIKPLPFEDPDRIVHIFNIYKKGRKPGSVSSWNQYRDFSENARLFEDFALSEPVEKMSRTKQMRGLRVTHDYFHVMKVRPLRGRFFTANEMQPGGPPIIVLSETAWRSDFLADPDIVGKKATFLNEVPYTIVGVGPKSLEAFDSELRFFLPYKVSKRDKNPLIRLGWHFTDLWARLAPGIDPSQALNELTAIETRWLEETVKASGEGSPTLDRRFEIGKPDPLKGRLIFLQSGALFVLLIGVVNALNMLLSRMCKRQYELCVRHSLGAGKAALMRLMLTESFLLALPGTAVGAGFALSSLGVFNRHVSTLIPNGGSVAVNGQVLLVFGFVSLAIALLMGLAPVMFLLKSDQIRKMDMSAKSSTATGNVRRLRRGLVVAQISITFALAIGAGLLIRSLGNVLSVDAGFDATKVIKAEIRLGGVYEEPDDQTIVRQRIVQAMRHIPGIESVGIMGRYDTVVGSIAQTEPIHIKGSDSEDFETSPLVIIKGVSGEYFATMGIPILDGRRFSPGEREDGLIVDETFAARHLRNNTPIGAEAYWGNRRTPPGGNWPQIVGVAGRANLHGLENRDGYGVLYQCLNQTPMRSFNILLRTARHPDAVIKEMRSALRDIHPGLPMFDPAYLGELLQNLHLDRQGTAIVVGLFAALAMFLAGIGVYGVLALDVAQRQREFGIRCALGATRKQLLWMVQRQALGMLGLGLSIGLVGSIAMGRLIESRLFDVTALDAATYGVAFLLMASAALLASCLPVRRAIGIAPIEALRAP